MLQDLSGSTAAGSGYNPFVQNYTAPSPNHTARPGTDTPSYSRLPGLTSLHPEQ